MASFNLHLQFNNKLYTFFLNSITCSDDIKHRVAELFRISADTFDIQVRDEHSKDRFVLDDEYVERLHERLPLTSINTLSGDILLNYSSLGELKYVELHLKESYVTSSKHIKDQHFCIRKSVLLLKRE